MNEANMKHFKAAQISGMEVSLKDLEKINSYALSKLEPADIFAFKVSMAGNEIDRDYEVFPRSTLVKLANLFVGKTVVKDHEHKSDNQIARIYSTELVENDLARMTKTGEVFTQLVAKCYMVKTSKNADLIAEIQAGIRKEVSLGCRVDKAICSICGTDNVKTYCEHFPGKRYNNNQLCYFSLENASDAYELSFVAVPAQAHAGTVKSYGKKPCHEEEMKMRRKAIEDVREVLREGGIAINSSEKRLTSNQVEKSGGQLTSGAGDVADVRENAPETRENVVNEGESTPKSADQTPNDTENASKSTPDPAPEKTDEEAKLAEKGDDVDAKEMLKQLHEIAQQLLVFQKSFMAQKEAEQPAPAPETAQGSEQASGDSQENPSVSEGDQPVEGQADAQAGGQEEAAAEKPAQKEANEPKQAEQEEPSPEGKPDEDEGSEEQKEAAASEEAAAKDKAAQARLRALDLALSLRKRS